MKSLIKSILAICVLALFAISCQPEEGPDYNAPVVDVEKIEILPSYDSLTVGDSITLQVNIYPDSATNKNYVIKVRKNADYVELDEETLLLKGLKPGTVEIAAVTDNGKTAVSQIVVVPVHVEKPKMTVTLVDPPVEVTHDDIKVEVTMSRDDLQFWIWIGNYETFKNYQPSSLLEYDRHIRQTLLNELKQAGAQLGLDVTMKTVIDNFASQGPGVYSLKELNLINIKPETQYIIWAYPINDDGNILCATNEISAIHVMTDVAPEGWVDPDDIVDPNYRAVEEVIINAPKDTIIAGETMELEITILPDSATNKEYTLEVSGGDKNSVEVVDLTHIRGVKAGTAYISAISKDNGKRADFKITVKKDPNAPDDEPEIPNDPKDPADYDNIITHSDYTVELIENTSSSITVKVTPTGEDPYYVWRTMTKNFEPGGYWSDPQQGDSHAVRDTYLENGDPESIKHTGESTITFNGLKADSEWTIMVFRCDAMGNKIGDLVKLNTFTKIAE